MKVRNILIGLLVVLMAFVFISCNDEPEEPAQPDTAQDVVYTLSTKKSVSEGYYDNDKPRLVFADKINEGDTLSLQFRSERDVYQFDIRNGSGKWVYQQDSSALTSFEVGEDGWITLTYTFDSKYYDGSSVTYPQEGFDIRFRGRYFKGDLFEVKNVKINGELIPLKDGDDDGFTLSGFELAAADALFGAKSYAVVYSVARPGDDDKTPLMEKVASGAKPAAANLEKTGYELELFTQYDEKGVGYVEESKITLEQLRDLAIEKDTIIYLKYTGIPRTVTFMNGEVQFDQKQTLHGTTVAKPETDPEAAAGYQFAAWCSDSGLTTPFDFTSAITADTTLYAKFNKVWTVSFNLNGKEATAIPSQTIIDGEKATAPAKPKTSGFRFKNWKLGEEIYDFTTSTVTEDIELVAEWEVAPTVNFTYDLNYDGAPAAAVVPVFLDEPAEEPEASARFKYAFVGWFDAAEGGNEYTFEEDVTEAKTLYAHWTEKQVTKLVASKGVNDGLWSYDKFSLDFAALGAPQLEDTVTIVFRTNRPIEEFNIRDPREGGDKLTGYRWVYGQSGASAFGDDYVVDNTTGWITFTYEFGENALRTDKSSTPSPVAVDYANYVTGLYIQFVGTLVAGDTLEIWDILYKGEPVADIGALVEKSYVMKGYTEGDISTVAYSAEKPAVTYVVQFLDPTDVDSDSNPKGAARVVASGDPVVAPTDGKWAGVVQWNTKADGTGDAWNFSDAITSDKILYSIWE